MATDLAPTIDPATVERVMLHGDLQKLSPAQKVSYYRAVCESVGLNPLTQPFQYIVLSGREVLYARREATEQLRFLHKVSIAIVAREVAEGCYIVTARASLPDGRSDENIGAVPIEGLKGEARSNALMKAETKAKRRVTLSICGLGMLDETEVESLPANEVPQTLSHTGMARVMTQMADAGETAQDTVQQTAPAPELPPGTVRIEKINAVKTKNPKVLKYFLTLSTGEEAQTINSRLAALAEAVCEANEPVVVVLKATKWGSEVESIKRLEPNESEPELMLTDDEIPF